MTLCEGIHVHFPHRNLGELGFEVYGVYVGFTFPFRERWGWTWGNLVRVYYNVKCPALMTYRSGYLKLPSFIHHRRS